MKSRRQARWRAAFCAAGLMLVFPAPAQNAPTPAPAVRLLSAPTNLVPPLPQSPVSFFRQLLVMTSTERDKSLTIYPPQVRERILAKIREYLALDPDERELRLDATELRWYLLPLLRESPTNRDARLAQVPDNLRGLVESRLEKWDALPPQMRQEFLDNEETLHYFSHVDPTNTPPSPGTQPGRWQALSEADRQQITALFDQFSKLTPEEERTALNTLSAPEQVQMEKTLQTFSKLPPAQRVQCVRAYTEFASMSPQERAEFLKNAERWSQMTPKERQAWRDLVAQVPLWPPLPRALIRPPPLPPPPPQLPLRSQPVVATNHL
jgi:hypothetical protein